MSYLCHIYVGHTRVVEAHLGRVPNVGEGVFVRNPEDACARHYKVKEVHTHLRVSPANGPPVQHYTLQLKEK